MKFQTTIPFLLALALIGGCKNSTVLESNDLGTIRGKVTEYGSTAVSGVDALPLPQQGGATITIAGTPFTTTSNANREWEIDRVPAGIYALIFSKPGFDTTILPQYEFSGAGTAFLEGVRINKTRPLLLDSILFTVTANRTGDSVTIYTLTFNCNLVGPDSIKYFLLTYYDSTRVDSLQSMFVTVTPGWPFTFTPAAYSQQYPWVNYLPKGQQGAPRPGETFYISIRAMAAPDGGYWTSPIAVWRKIVLP